MDDRITIIEGPPPVFEPVNEAWTAGLNESVNFHSAALTRLRTYNGPALVERCHRAWSKKEAIFLHYRNRIGLEEKVPILAARSTEVEGGQVLFLWIQGSSEFDEMDESNDSLN
ncbi:MAG: hypothetical protein AB9897_00330 [Anaerolineaceae bacterium]